MTPPPESLMLCECGHSFMRHGIPGERCLGSDECRCRKSQLFVISESQGRTILELRQEISEWQRQAESLAVEIERAYGGAVQLYDVPAVISMLLRDRQKLSDEVARLTDLSQETCDDCDHGVRGGKLCESCGGSGKITYRDLYQATAQRVKELREMLAAKTK